MEECYTFCPECGLEVSFKWNKGFITEPHNVLIGDCVYHGECWDKIMQEYFPPEEEEKDERQRSHYADGVSEQPEDTQKQEDEDWEWLRVTVEAYQRRERVVGEVPFRSKS